MDQDGLDETDQNELTDWNLQSNPFLLT